MSKKPEIICYSRTGNSRRLADEIVTALNGNLQVVTTANYKWPVLGWLAAALDGMRKVAAQLNETVRLPDQDGLVVLVGPVWVGQPASPLNTVLDILKKTDLHVAAALTCGDKRGGEAPLDALEARLGRPLVVRLIVSDVFHPELSNSVALKTFALRCNIGEEWQG